MGVGRTVEASLGYYIYPLVAVAIGAVVLREGLGALQAVAVALAAGAVLILTVGLGAPPWISLTLATTFGVYGLLKTLGHGGAGRLGHLGGAAVPAAGSGLPDLAGGGGGAETCRPVTWRFSWPRAR